jgi:Asp-tRNA(Asn)/Glu-tRNA(Gln) amidotransferase A subunit family amidase
MSRSEKSRRSFLQDASAVTALAAAPPLLGAAKPEDDALQLLDLSATEAVARISRGELKAETYASALLARCEALASLNAFITLEPQKVLDAARACDRRRKAGAPLPPLFGLPIPVKDSVNTAEYPTTAGTPALRRFRPAEDAPVVKSLRAAGAIVLGKTNLHELSFGWTSNNLAFGAVHNPYDRRCIAGGSSGGTAAAVAARMAPLGVAEDTQGSIRVPAAMCGIAGFRPTTGRYSTRGCAPVTPLFDQVGPHARSVTDLALFDSVLTGDRRPLQPHPLKGLRFGIVRDYWFEGLDEDVELVASRALERLRDAGAEVVETRLPGVQRLVEMSTGQVEYHDARLALPRYLSDFDAPVTLAELLQQASPEIQSLFRNYILPGAPHYVSEAAYAAACDTYLPALRRLYRDYFAQYEVSAVVFPTTMAPAPLIGQDTIVEIRGKAVSFSKVAGRNISPGSTAGLPGLVLPAGLSRTGLPIGIELDGPSGSDRKLLAIGLSVERILGPMPGPSI